MTGLIHSSEEILARARRIDRYERLFQEARRTRVKPRPPLPVVEDERLTAAVEWIQAREVYQLLQQYGRATAVDGARLKQAAQRYQEEVT
jgi:hypothetical protein